MRCARSVCLLWLLAGIALGVQAQETKEDKAAKPAPPVASTAKPAADRASSATEDDDFLEFLGSVDSDAADDDWLDYLAQTDILKVAKAKKKTEADAENRPASEKTGK